MEHARRHDDIKPTNPKEAIGDTKVPLHLVSPVVKAYQAIAHFLGNIKYGRWNYRALGARASTYYSAANRHLDKWYEGEELDQVDGTPHLANALACINILIEASEGGNLQDDRPPSRDLNPLYERIEKMQAALIAKYGDRRPRHYTIADASLRTEEDAYEAVDPVTFITYKFDNSSHPLVAGCLCVQCEVRRARMNEEFQHG